MKISDNERKERAQKREYDKAKLEHVTKMRELDLRERELETAGTHKQVSGAITATKVSLPKYVAGEDLEVFFRSFERLANMHEWPKSESQRVKIMTSLKPQYYKDLDLMHGRTGKSIDTQCKEEVSHSEKAIRVASLLEHWVESEKVTENYHKMYDLILREQLLFSAPLELQIWLRERQPETSDALVDMAEAFQLAHQYTGINRGNVGYQRDSGPNRQGMYTGSI